MNEPDNRTRSVDEDVHISAVARIGFHLSSDQFARAHAPHAKVYLAGIEVEPQIISQSKHSVSRIAVSN